MPLHKILKKYIDGLRALKRTTTNALGSFRYGKGSTFQAERYWRYRLSRHGLSLKGVGNAGLSVKDNAEVYAGAKKVFLNLCSRENMTFENISVLDVGCENGFYAEICKEQGIKKYVGIDLQIRCSMNSG